jgi:hypothetical protein
MKTNSSKTKPTIRRLEWIEEQVPSISYGAEIVNLSGYASIMQVRGYQEGRNDLEL